MTAKELKASILDLAVRGKLVPQDPNDEPASVLLEKIRAEKRRLVKAGKIKKEKNPSEIYIAADGKPYEKFADGSETCIEDEIPFELPKGWVWARLGNVLVNRDSERIPLAVSEREKQTDKRYDYYGASGVIDKVDGYLFDTPLLLVGEDGANLLTRNTPIAFIAQSGKYWVNNHAHVLDCPYFQVLKYVESFINAISLAPYVTGTAQPKMNQEKMNAILIPLPPLAEQQRICAQIERLASKVENYAEIEKKLSEFESTFPATLKKSILQYAVEGKLVPQDPNDEPASVLVERIAEERKALVKAGKLKRDKNESVIFRGADRLAYETRNGETVCIQDEIPFEIPDSWEWVRLGNITTFLHRGKSPTYVPHSDCPMFAQKCNQWDGIHLEKCKFCDEAKYKTFQDEYHLRDYDVVVNSTGTGTLGRVGIFHDSELAKHGYLSIVPDSHVTVVRTSLHDLNQYIYHYLCTKFCWEWMNNNADGSTKQKELYTSTLASLLIPIPPLAEQRRIASAIPLLLNNCNQLKQQPTM